MSVNVIIIIKYQFRLVDISVRFIQLMVLKIEKVNNYQYLSDFRSPKKKSTFKQFMKLRNAYLNQRVFAQGSYTIEQMIHTALFAYSSIVVVLTKSI